RNLSEAGNREAAAQAGTGTRHSARIGECAMTCEEITGLLADYLKGGMAAEESARVREHIEQCAACRKTLPCGKNWKRCRMRSLALNSAHALTPCWKVISKAAGRKL